MNVTNDYDANGVYNPQGLPPCEAHKGFVKCGLPEGHPGPHMGYDMTKPDNRDRARYGPPHPGMPVLWSKT